MNERRVNIFAQIDEERERQFNLPGSEWDTRHKPNDWVAIATHYLGEEVYRAGSIPERVHFERSLIKSAAVIISALEHIENMKNRGELSEQESITDMLLNSDGNDK